MHADQETIKKEMQFLVNLALRHKLAAEKMVGEIRILNPQIKILEGDEKQKKMKAADHLTSISEIHLKIALELFKVVEEYKHLH
jgi:hypothetical protein